MFFYLKGTEPTLQTVSKDLDAVFKEDNQVADNKQTIETGVPETSEEQTNENTTQADNTPQADFSNTSNNTNQETNKEEINETQNE